MHFTGHQMVQGSKNTVMFSSKTLISDMDILDDMGVSKLSTKVFF